MVKKKPTSDVQLDLLGMPRVDQDAIQIVFTYWQNIMDRPKASLTRGRRRHLSARLKEFSVEDLKLVIDTVASDPWWMGRNERNQPYNEIDNIFRNTERVERFLQQASRQNRSSTLYASDTPDEGVLL